MAENEIETEVTEMVLAAEANPCTVRLHDVLLAVIQAQDTVCPVNAASIAYVLCALLARLTFEFQPEHREIMRAVMSGVIEAQYEVQARTRGRAGRH